MTRLAYALLASALSFTAATSLAAQDAPGDVKCLLLSNLFSKAAPDDKGRQAATLAKAFYMGRVGAKMSPAQMKAAFAAQAKTIDPNVAGPAMNQCMQAMAESNARLEAIGRELEGSKPK